MNKRDAQILKQNQITIFMFFMFPFLALLGV